MKNLKQKKPIHFLTLLLLMGIAGNSCASVVMTGTRIIYSGNTREKTIQLHNTSEQPYIVNAQIDNEQDPKHSVPFFVTPQTFRIEPSSGQSIRLIFTGEKLPQDRESIYYFSFSQLPYIKNKDKSQNQLVLALTNQVKIFYRPTGIESDASKTEQNLTFQLKNNRVEVSNPGGYYAAIRSAELVCEGKKYQLADLVMISPKSKAEWPLPSGLNSIKNAKIHLVTVNDYGVNISTEHRLLPH